MKKMILILLIFVGSFQARSQNMFITSALATSVSGGVNVNLKTASGNGAGYLSNSYSITGNVISLDVCYWFNNTLPFLTFENDFFIPLSIPATYTINIKIILSTSTTVCTNFSIPDTETIQYSFLSKTNFSLKDSVNLFPNPTDGIVYFEELNVKIRQAKIADVSGKTVKIITKGIDKTLNLTDLQVGMYFITLETENGTINKKILIKR